MACPLRIKIGRRLGRVGALALKGSVYALPVSDSCREDFSWIRREIVDGGGEAVLLEARAVEGVADAELQQMFRDARAKDYAALSAELAAVGDKRRTENSRERRTALAEVIRIEQRFREVQRVDFFQGGSSAELAAKLEELKQRIEQRSKLLEATPRETYRAAEYQGRTWFEVLCRRFGVKAPEILRLGEVIHDLDVKDGRYAHPETEGLRKMLDAIVAQYARDPDRLHAAAALFDLLTIGRTRA